MTDTTLSPEQIADFLRNHPGFLDEHPEVFEFLKVGDARHGAVSLLERQTQVLRERNAELHNRLSRLVDIARDNDRLFEKTRLLVLHLLEASSFTELTDALCDDLRREFGSDTTSLLVYHPVEISGMNAGHVRQLAFTDLPEALQIMLSGRRAICGAMRPRELEALFAVDHEKVKSAAMVPLHHRRSLGLLAIGSFDADHFKSSLDTLFINHIGEVVSRRLAAILAVDDSARARRA